MPLCKLVFAMFLLVVTTNALANNGQLTQSDLDSVARSNEIIHKSSTDEELKQLLEPPKTSQKLQDELRFVRDHARRLNGSLSRADIIKQPPSTEHNQVPLINFEAMAEVIDSTPTEFTTDGSIENPQDDSSLSQVGSANSIQQKKYENADDPMVLWIFVSSSMPDHQMRMVLNTASLWGARVVYRGLRPQDHTVNDMVRGIWKLKAKLIETQDDMKMHAKNPEIMEEINKASINADSMAFERFAVDRVPMMVYERKRPDGTKQIGKVHGIITPEYLQSEVERRAAMPDHDGSEIYLGEMGSTFEIVERSIVEEMKDRIQMLDFEKMKEEAIKRYWIKRKFHTFPTTTKDKVYQFDPSVIVTDDVLATNGTVLAKKGDLLNPLMPYKGYDIVPAHMTMYIFDANDPNEVAFVKSMSVNNSRGELHLVTTQIDRDRGFEHLEELNQHFTIPITLLTEDIVNRFDIEATPTRIISTDEGLFQINEYSRQSVVQYNMVESDMKLEQATSPSAPKIDNDSSKKSLTMNTNSN